jgi:hypothetical protein
VNLNRALIEAGFPVCSFVERKQGIEALFMEIAGRSGDGEPSLEAGQ